MEHSTQARRCLKCASVLAIGMVCVQCGLMWAGTNSDDTRDVDGQFSDLLRPRITTTFPAPAITLTTIGTAPFAVIPTAWRSTV